MNRIRAAGFTLIELLVVIGILSLLIVTFVPDLINAWSTANQAADQEQMRRHFQWAQTYKTKFGSFPREGGHKFILDTWVRGICEHTPQNLEKFFSPQLRKEDPYYQDEILKQDVSKLWPDLNSVSSQDTHYAGRAKQHKIGMDSGNEAWMANDNEGYWSFNDGTINVLYGDGVVRALLLERELKEEFGWTKEKGPFPVGPDSPHPALQKLEK